MDVSELRKDLEEKYPGAKIVGLEEKPLIRIVGEKKEIKKDKPKEKKKSKRDKDESLIRIIE